MEAFERESWKSGEWAVGALLVEVMIEGTGGVGVTTISRHWGDWEVEFGLWSGTGPLSPGIVVGLFGEGATDWKA